jgi:uncharacterized protein YjiS (DUF1127 family)
MATRIEFDFPTLAAPVIRSMSGGGLIVRLRAAVARWRERRILATLDDRMLRDIGVSRSQALAEARKPCWKQ